MQKSKSGGSRWLPLALVWLLAGPVSAVGVDVFEFESPEQEARYQKLTEELRCTVCQNQNIAGSNADLAKDLRRKTYEMLRAGKTDEEITQYMVDRYGNFVLYRPPMSGVALLLWVVPFVLVVLSGWGIVRAIKRRGAAGADAEAVEHDAERVHKAEALLRNPSREPGRDEEAAK